jgi:hypothetical protein
MRARDSRSARRRRLSLTPEIAGCGSRRTPDADPDGTRTCAEGGEKLAPQLAPDPGLARVHEAWPSLPEHIKAAVLALIGAAR